VSASTAQLVQEVAVRLGYRVNPAARGLRTSGQQVVGVVVDDAAINLESNIAPALWWPRAVFALVNALGEHNIAVQLISAGQEVSVSSLPIDALITVERPGGHAVIPPGIPFGIPIFFGGDLIGDPRASAQVAPNYSTVTSLGLDHLVDAGSKSPGLLTIPARVSFAEHFETAYRTWCEQHDCEPRVSGENGGSIDRNIAILLEEGCDSVLAINNASVEIVSALTSRVRVPQDVKLLVVSEGLLEAQLRPTVSVVSLDGAAAGRAVASHVVSALETGRATDVEIVAKLIVGESTRR